MKYADDQALGTIYNNLGKLSIESEDWDKASYYLEHSLDCRKRINDLNGLAKTYNNLTGYHIILRNLDKANEVGLKALEYSEKAGAMSTRANALYNLSEIYQAKDDYRLALTTYKKYKELTDTLLNESSIRKQTELQVKYEFEKEEKAKEIYQQKVINRYIIAIIILLFGLIVSFMLYKLAINRSRLIKLENENLEKDLNMRVQDISLKDKELASSVLFLLKKNELLNDISLRLLQLKKGLKSENHNLLHRIILDIQEEAKDDMWDEFDVRFQMVYEDYYKKLKAHAPDLTPGDLKICTFLKLNMTTKEISSITKQSVKSIEVARTRIRKKLNLTNTEVNLVSYLMEL